MKMHIDHRRRMRAAFLILGLSWLLCVSAQAGRILQNVAVRPQMLDAAGGDAVQISWNQSLAAEMRVLICNLDGVVVRVLHDGVQGRAGVHQISWDGKDTLGRPCPNGAYVPIVKVRTRTMGYDVYNPTMLPWGERLTTRDISYDPDAGLLTYRLVQPVLCQMRIGEKDGGPCYRTLFGWQPRQAGSHTAAWDGMDTQGVVDLSGKEKLEIVLDAFSLPPNAIMIRNSDNSSHHFEDIPDRFPLHPPSAEHLFLHALHARSACRDFAIGVDLGPSNTGGDTPAVVSGILDLNVFIDDAAVPDFLMREKIEIYVYMDGRFVLEEPRKTLPARLTLDTARFSNGQHILTLNVRTNEDHIAVSSLKVMVKN
jgi:hypothetical protein